MAINFKIKATFCGGTGSKKSMNKSRDCMFEVNTVKLQFLTFSHFSFFSFLIISRTKIHIFDMEVHEAHQQGHSYSSFPSTHFRWNNTGLAPGDSLITELLFTIN